MHFMSVQNESEKFSDTDYIKTLEYESLKCQKEDLSLMVSKKNLNIVPIPKKNISFFFSSCQLMIDFFL